MVAAAYLDLTGAAVPGGDPARPGAFLVENYDPIGALGYWRAASCGLASWAGSLRAVDETAWFARDDLRPFGLMCLRMGWRGGSAAVHAGAAPRSHGPAARGTGRAARRPGAATTAWRPRPTQQPAARATGDQHAGRTAVDAPR